MQFLSIWDFILLPAYVMIIYLVSYKIKLNKIDKNPEYKYFVKGIMAKIIGGLFLVIIYAFWYKGGDTTNYFDGARAISRLLWEEPKAFFSIMGGDRGLENWLHLNREGMYHYYIFRDPKSFAVCRYAAPFAVIGGNSFMVTTVLIAIFTFNGMWRLFQIFYTIIPHLMMQFAIAILFMPSVIFWGSGILKDSFTVCSATWMIYNLYNIFVNRRKYLQNSAGFFFNAFILTTLKPYIFISVLLGVVLWFFFLIMDRFESRFLKSLAMPVILIIVLVISSFIISQIGQTIGGSYSSVDKILEKAMVTQQDLVREQYGGNYFDIGKIDPTFGGLLKKAPAALLAGLFRPFIWECNNPVMFLSGIENIVISLLTFYVIFKIRLKFLLQAMLDNHLIMFSIVFAISFGFSVGLSTANFGALVRYRIPLIPFLMSSLFMVIDKYDQQRQELKKIEEEKNMKFVHKYKGQNLN